MADEPSAGLSTDNVRAIFDRIEWIRNGRISVFLVVQNATRALATCDHAYVTEAGRIVLVDEGRALLDSPAVRRHYPGIK